MNKIAGMTMIYKINIDTLLHNIDTYIEKLDILIVIDNNDIYEENIKSNLNNKYKNIKYISNQKNLGVATALNIACDKAKKLGYDWILTMDQDSSFVNFDKYIKCFNNIEDKNHISIITPNPFTKSNHTMQDCQKKEKNLAITSGSLLNLSLFDTIGRFDDKLFIDEVDHDYCMRSKLANFTIIELSNIPLIHTIGEVIKNNKEKKKTQHSAIRFYYRTRNNFYMAKQYKDNFPELYSYRNFFYFHIYKVFFKILRHQDNKLKKFKYMYLGWRDFYKKNYGKFEDIT